jgi:hypothetical protein
MNDDWRLQIDFDDEAHASSLTRRLDAQQLQHDLSGEFHDRVIVTRDGARVYLYSGSCEQILKSRDAVQLDASRHGWRVAIGFSRWHPISETWEDPGKALPADDAARIEEREALMARERAETAMRGYPEFEVRVDLPSHHDASRLAHQLREEGIPTVHRWRYLLVGATDEDSASELADRIRIEAPAGSRARVEGTFGAAQRAAGPFAIMSS